MARPTKYNPEVAAKIVGLVQAGANRNDAAQAAGIGETTFQTWMHKYPEFRARVLEADSASVSIAENSLRKKNPLAYLQAKRPRIYGNLGQTRTELTGPAGAPIGVAIADADRDAIIAAAVALGAAARSGVADSS